LVIENKYSKAIINPNLGGCLQSLVLNNRQIIKEIKDPAYFSGAILFPFVNRIKNGVFRYNNSEYKLEINEVSKNNALHGMVHNKVCNLVRHRQNKLELFLENVDAKNQLFNFSILLKYEIYEYSLKLIVKIKNTGRNIFPFSIGWHPYFFSNNLKNSNLIFKGIKKIILDKKGIPEMISNDKTTIINKFNGLDNCYKILGNNISFITPDYKINFKSSFENRYLQIYQPIKIKDVIALEPTTSISDSFNNKIDLMEIQPREEKKFIWLIDLNINK
tara:strand:- start:104 stop:928 length:825 start_codon:yes stop_codon:yes gene_type:complete